MSVFPAVNNERVYTQSKIFLQNKDNLNQTWDVIVVGSGMAGMCCAAALAKFGRKVLVLEKHYLPGGYTHMFSRKGAEWDVGVHAIGDMHAKGQTRRQLDWLTNKKIEMISLGNPYDVFYYPDHFNIGFPSSIKEFKKELLEKFPDEEKAINKYFELCFLAIKQTVPYFVFKTFPKWLALLCESFLKYFIRDWWGVTTDEILNETGASFKLRNVLVAQWGYYGSMPKDSSFALQALIVGHFGKGAYYPKGGAKVFAAYLLENVLKAGGQVVCQAEVESLLMDEDKCFGVKLKTGEELKSKKVISAIPAKLTVNKLVSKKWQNSQWANSIRSIGYSPSYICLNLIFEGDIKKFGASSSNKWFISEWDMNKDELIWDITKSNEKARILYVSFPSLKDPEHVPGEKNQHTGECVTFIPWSNFEKWQETHYQDRPVDYAELKKEMENKIMEQLKENMPELMKLCVYHEISTPLTAQHFVNAVNGSIYGMEATPKRFKNDDLRVRTPIDNFYLSGVDVTTTGVGGAMASGLLAAATIEPRVYLKLI